MELVCIKKGNAIYPLQEYVDDLDKIPAGKMVTVEVKRPRNINHHRLFFALVKYCWEQSDTERYPTMEAFRAALTISAGHRLEYQLPNGQVYYLAKSIAFHNMDQIAFKEFFERCLDAIERYFMPGASEAVRQKVYEITGLAA